MAKMRLNFPVCYMHFLIPHIKKIPVDLENLQGWGGEDVLAWATSFDLGSGNSWEEGSTWHDGD